MSAGRELGLAWPEQVYSMSHVAIPFSPEDPLYGASPPEPGSDELRLGHLSPRGEKGVLIVPIQQFLRLRFNPFFPYVAERLIASVE